MNRRRLALAVLLVATVASAGHAFAAGTAEGPTTPTGIGDLLPTPDLTHGDTRNLFESYSPMAYHLDLDEGRIPNGFDGILNAYANMIMLAIVAITRGAISVGWWLFSLTDIKDVSDATTGIITSSSAALTSWLLPAALAFGAVVAYARHRGSREGGAFSQVLWLVAAGVLAISFTTSASMWVNGVDSARQLGATAVMDASSRAITSDNSEPFAMPAPSYDRGSQRDKLLRQSADATWRAFTVTPWCLAEFGSLDACKRYGKGMLDLGLEGEKRTDYIKREIERREGGSNAATVEWTKGGNPVGRIGILTLALVAAIIFAALSVMLCFAAAMAFLGVLLMLIAGVFFACLWVIPGRPRQWGINWFETLVGLVLQSILALLVFGSALSLVTAVYGLSGSMGWLPVNGLALSVLFAAFRLRRMLEGVTQMMQPGAGSSGLLGALALRQGAKMVSSVLKRGRGRGQSSSSSSSRSSRRGGPFPYDGTEDDPNRIHTVPPRPSNTGGTAGTSTGSDRRTIFAYYRGPDHTNPQLPRATRALPGRPSDPQLPSGPDSPQLPPGPGGHPPQRPDLPNGRPGSGAAQQLPGGSTRPAGRSRAGTRPGDISEPAVHSRGTVAPADRAHRETGPPRAYTPGKATSRYQTRIVSRADLREGPPDRTTRVRPAQPSARKFRSYQPPVVREGVTLHVPEEKQ